MPAILAALGVGGAEAAGAGAGAGAAGTAGAGAGGLSAMNLLGGAGGAGAGGTVGWPNLLMAGQAGGGMKPPPQSPMGQMQPTPTPQMSPLTMMLLQQFAQQLQQQGPGAFPSGGVSAVGPGTPFSPAEMQLMYPFMRGGGSWPTQ